MLTANNNRVVHVSFVPSGVSLTYYVRTDRTVRANETVRKIGNRRPGLDRPQNTRDGRCCSTSVLAVVPRDLSAGPRRTGTQYKPDENAVPPIITTPRVYIYVMYGAHMSPTPRCRRRARARSSRDLVRRPCVVPYNHEDRRFESAENYRFRLGTYSTRDQ